MLKKIPFSKTVLRIALLNSVVMIFLYLIFNLFTLIHMNYLLDDLLESSIEHEFEKLIDTIEYANGKIIVNDWSELKESDFTEVTDNPFLLQIYNNDGEVLLQSQNLSYFPAIKKSFPNKINNLHFEDLKLNNYELRVGYQKLIDKNGNQVGYIQLANLKSYASTITNSMLVFDALTFPIILILIIVLSIFLAKKSYSPINKIINLANRISVKNLSQRLEYEADSNDELGRLRDTLNNLFDRLEMQVNEISQFTDNASHHLMTPLTVSSTELEYLLKKERSPNEYRQAIPILKEQNDKMVHIVKTLLMLARDCEHCQDEKSAFSLSSLIDNHIKPAFNSGRFKYYIEENIYLRGKADYFMVVIQNLLENAVKYSDKNEVIILRAEKQDNTAYISVEDFGIGINENEKEEIFQRFQRGTNAEKLGIKGYGLGLSFVKMIIRRMGGQIEVQENNPKGTKFIIILPILKSN